MPLRAAPVPSRRRLLAAGLGAVGLGTLGGLAPWTWARAATNTGENARVALSALDRLTWGAVVPASREAPRFDLDRLLADQLMAGPEQLPAPVRERIGSMALTKTPAVALVRDIRRQEMAIRDLPDGDERQAGREALQARLRDLQREAVDRSLLRMLHSPYQLQEKMTWFWMNHFNISIRKSSHMRAMLPDFEASVIRPRALGRFEDLLGATVRHPAMLLYLDNNQNANKRINENYGRELLELHTLGVGSGYTQDDVTAMSRILTGLGLRFEDTLREVPEAQKAAYVNDGIFEFLPGRHDGGDKTLLGTKIPGGGLEEVDAAVRLLARHPATAAHISRKLATWFVADTPPPAMVQAMSQTFAEHDGDMAAVLRTMFRHDAFQAALSQDDFKDPLRYVLASVRLLHGDGPPVVNARPLSQWLSLLGQPLYERDTPDGYPLRRAEWSGSGQMAARFEVARRISGASAALTDAQPGPDGKRAPPPAAAREWVQATLEPSLGTATRQALAQARNTQDWNLLFLSSPEFMLR